MQNHPVLLILYYLVWPNPKRLGLEDEGALSERERHSARLGVEGKVKVAVGPRHGEAGHHVVLVGDPDGAEAAGSRGHDAAADDRDGAVFGERDRVNAKLIVSIDVVTW